MIDVARLKENEKLQKLRRWFPAIFFITGFVWDAWVLGTKLTTFDLILLLVYFSLSTAILVILGREIRFRFSEYLNHALQFFLGGIYNALVIFYFISSANLGTFLVVALLTTLLVGNEFLRKRYHRVTLSWTMYCIAAVMLFNFLLPTIFRSLSMFWFYASTLLALALVTALRLVSKQEKASMTPTFIAAGLLLALFTFHLIPPVPLSQKKMLICHDLQRRGTRFEARVDRRFNPFTWFGQQTVTQATGEKIYCFTSIFVPPGIETEVTHEWSYYDPNAKEWEARTRLTFPIHSGRKEGYRGYSYKRNLTPGEWKVVALSENGLVIGETKFRVVAGVAKTRPVKL